MISLFAAVEDVSEQQGGTVFIPGTHIYGGSDNNLGGQANALMELFRTRCNYRIFWHNLKTLWRMRSDATAPLAPGEFRDRVFSRKWDQHQPNVLRFVLGKNAQFSIRMLRPGRLWTLYRHRKALDDLFTLVQTAPRKGSVILYRSDLLHAGPDNRSPDPRRIFGMSIARDRIDPKFWHDGYSPHPTLMAHPLCLGDLLDAAPLAGPSGELNHPEGQVVSIHKDRASEPWQGRSPADAEETAGACQSSDRSRLPLRSA